MRGVIGDLETRNPTAADADDDGHKHHEDEDHQHGVTGDKLQNGIEPRQHRSKNGGDIRDKGGKSTSGRRRQTFSFPIRLFMVNEPQSPNTHESDNEIVTNRREVKKIKSFSNWDHFKAPRSHVTIVTKVKTTMTKAQQA